MNAKCVFWTTLHIRATDALVSNTRKRDVLAGERPAIQRHTSGGEVAWWRRIQRDAPARSATAEARILTFAPSVDPVDSPFSCAASCVREVRRSLADCFSEVLS